MDILIAEKYEYATDLARALQATKKGNGCFRGTNLIVTWCSGHLLQLAEPQEYNPDFAQWSWKTLPILPDQFKLQIRDSKRGAQYRVIEALLRSNEVTRVINGCDPEREGELIFDEVMTYSGCRKPVVRMWTSANDDQGIRDAFAALKPASHYSALRDAAWCRSQADWLVGINGTRAQTLAVRDTNAGSREVQTIGRVQVPTVYLVYQHDERIRNFVSETFWNVLATFQHPAGPYTGRFIRTGPDGKEPDRLSTAAEAEAIARRVHQQKGTLTRVQHSDERRLPEELYDITALQKACNELYGLTLDQTLSTAQSLYQIHKVISYPRTNSRHLTPDEVPSLPERLDTLEQQPAYRDIVAQLKAEGKIARGLGKRFIDASKVQGHYAILPTSTLPSGLSRMEQQVYDLIARRFLAAYFPERIDAKTVLETQVGTDLFRTTGTVCKQQGWTAVDPSGSKKKDKDPDAATLPNVSRNDSVTTVEANPKQGKTTPPKPLTDKDLVTAMQTAGRTIDDDVLAETMKDKGLGTGATRAHMVKDLIEKKGYLRRDGRHIRCSDSGRRLIESIRIEQLLSPLLTAEWEYRLAQMEQGTYSRERFIQEVRTFTRELVQSIQSGVPTEALGRAERTGPNGTSTETLCNACRKTTLNEIPRRTSGTFLKCPVCGFTRDVDAQVIPNGCKAPGCGADLIERKGIHSSFFGCVQHPRCTYKEPGSPTAKPSGSNPTSTPGSRTTAPTAGTPKASTTPAPTAERWRRTEHSQTCPRCKGPMDRLERSGTAGTEARISCRNRTGCGFNQSLKAPPA